MKLEQLRLAEDGTGMFDEQMKFVRSLTVELRADETTLVLLLVLSLFSPDRDNLTNRDYVGKYLIVPRLTLLTSAAVIWTTAICPRMPI